MIFELAQDFSATLATMPREHSHHRILNLLEEAIRRDIHFIARHTKDYPQALFQCFWNTCWWYDCSDLEIFERGVSGEKILRDRPESRLSHLMEEWATRKQAFSGKFAWVRSLRPPSFPLGGGQYGILRFSEWRPEATALNVKLELFAQASHYGNSALTLWNFRTGAELGRVSANAGLGCLSISECGSLRRTPFFEL